MFDLTQENECIKCKWKIELRFCEDISKEKERDRIVAKASPDEEGVTFISR